MSAPTYNSKASSKRGCSSFFLHWVVRATTSGNSCRGSRVSCTKGSLEPGGVQTSAPSPAPLPRSEPNRGGLDTLGRLQGGSGQPHHNPQPSPGSWRVREHPKPCPHSDQPGVAAGAVTSPGELPKRQPDREKVAAHPGVFLSATALHDEEKPPALAAGLCHKQWDVGTVSCMVLHATSH